jgi:hypothetical protein
MIAYKPTRALGGISMSTKKRGGSAVGRLKRLPIEGKGVPQEFYEKPIENKFVGLSPHTGNKMEGVKLKSSRPKKYISLNF